MQKRSTKGGLCVVNSSFRNHVKTSLQIVYNLKPSSQSEHVFNHQFTNPLPLKLHCQCVLLTTLLISIFNGSEPIFKTRDTKREPDAIDERLF